VNKLDNIKGEKPMAKSDIVVFRKQDGKLVVRPSVFAVEKKGNNNTFRIRNDAENDITVVIPNDANPVTTTLKPSKNGNGHKKDIDVTGITQNGNYVVFYRVFMVGEEEAEGESAPALIIDD